MGFNSYKSLLQQCIRIGEQYKECQDITLSVMNVIKTGLEKEFI